MTGCKSPMYIHSMEKVHIMAIDYKNEAFYVQGAMISPRGHTWHSMLNLNEYPYVEEGGLLDLTTGFYTPPSRNEIRRKNNRNRSKTYPVNK